MARQNYIPWGDNNMMKKAALIAGALLLAGCASSADSTETVPPTATETASSASPSASTPAVTEAASPSPTATAGTLELTPDQRVFVVSALRYWPTASASDELILAMGDVACSGLAVNDFAGAVDYVRDMMPAGATLDQATLFTITSVMSICPEYDSLLPG